ncbi:MAG: YceD family protein [Thermoleophilaceae bacterium]
MGRRTDIFDVGRLGLSSGEGRRLDLDVPVEDLDFGGQRYTVPGGGVAARLDVSHTTTGYSLRLRFDAALAGPCMRCLEEADPRVDVDAREVDQLGGGEELESPYLDEEQLDLRAWARDALALALPAQIVCREECLGLCPVCGENLNEAGPEHAHEREPDPRWDALRELRLD